MDQKTAAEILIKMLEKHIHTKEEVEAITVAIGILSWSYLSQSKMKDRKAKKQLLLSSK